MAKLVARYESSTVEESVLEALVAAGASEAAAVLAQSPLASQVCTHDPLTGRFTCRILIQNKEVTKACTCRWGDHLRMLCGRWKANGMEW